MTTSSADAGGARPRRGRPSPAPRTASGRRGALKAGLLASAILHAVLGEAVAFPRADAAPRLASADEAFRMVRLPPRLQVPEAPEPVSAPLPPQATGVDVSEPATPGAGVAVPEPREPTPRPPEVRPASLEDRPGVARADVPPLLEAPDELRRRLRRHYPTRLERLRIGGVVELRLYVDRRGTVSRVEVSESSGHGRLDRAAAELAGEMTFLPALVRDRTVGIWVAQRICFAFVGRHEADPTMEECERSVALSRR